MVQSPASMVCMTVCKHGALRQPMLTQTLSQQPSVNKKGMGDEEVQQKGG